MSSPSNVLVFKNNANTQLNVSQYIGTNPINNIYTGDKWIYYPISIVDTNINITTAKGYSLNNLYYILQGQGGKGGPVGTMSISPEMYTSLTYPASGGGGSGGLIRPNVDPSGAYPSYYVNETYPTSIFLQTAKPESSIIGYYIDTKTGEIKQYSEKVKIGNDGGAGPYTNVTLGNGVRGATGGSYVGYSSYGGIGGNGSAVNGNYGPKGYNGKTFADAFTFKDGSQANTSSTSIQIGQPGLGGMYSPANTTDPYNGYGQGGAICTAMVYYNIDDVTTVV